MLSGKKILMIDDDAVLADIYKRQLAEEGAAVTLVTEGKKGLALLQKESFDLLLLDRTMGSSMSGFEVLKRLREDEKTAHLPVIMLTNLELKDDELRIIDEHAVSGYFVKSKLPASALADSIVGVL